MDYKEMWETLRSNMEKRLAYHTSGEMQSILESVEGEKLCKEFLDMMDSIQKDHRITDENTQGTENISRRVTADIDLSICTEEHGCLVDYTSKWYGRLCAAPTTEKYGWRVYYKSGIFCGILDEQKVAIWNVQEDSLRKG